jgi:hypothetical protein
MKRNRAMTIACCVASAALMFAATSGTGHAATHSLLSSHPLWMTETDQFGLLGPERSVVIRQGDLMMAEPSVGDQVIGAVHYSRISTCFVNGTYRRGKYMMPCQSVEDDPPKPGQVAFLDLEPWTISDALGHKEPCKQDALFAKEIRPENITPIFNIYSRTSRHIKCAAIAAGRNGYVLLGGQDLEEHPALMLRTLNQEARLAKSANPKLPWSHIMFGVSTRAKYNATPRQIAAAYMKVHDAHRDWMVQFNIITFDGSAWKAPRFIRLLAGKDGKYASKD